jgi:DNA-directed RNA polymerase subunit RPC12/RpoP
MEILFTCPACKQQLEAESAMSGSTINCPACNHQLVIPEADPANLKSAGPSKHDEKHFAVPVSDKPTESLIQKPNPPLEAAAKHDGSKLMRVKCIRHSDCVEVGKDNFDLIVTDFLNKVGETNITNVSVFNYQHLDLGTRQMITDYGIMIVYRS